MSDTYVDEDFFNALALLHSTDENSAEELRRMLDACIEKKYGPDKTLAARMPRRFLQNTDDAITSIRMSKKYNHVQERCIETMENEIWDGFEVVSSLESDVTENITDPRTIDMEVFEINYENYCDNQSVPRISIPDEGSADGTVCKVFFPQLNLYDSVYNLHMR